MGNWIWCQNVEHFVHVDICKKRCEQTCSKFTEREEKENNGKKRNLLKRLVRNNPK